MESISLNIPRYPMLRALVRYGGWLPSVSAIAVLLAGVAVAVRLESVTIGVTGLVAAALMYAIMRTTVELVTLITDMLLPK